MSQPSPPPEAQLIERLRESARPKMSVRKAAAAAGISEGRWRQIIKGFNQVSAEVRVPSSAPAETLARMARVVGATPEQLREVGRQDAAEYLEEIAAATKGGPVSGNKTFEGVFQEWQQATMQVLMSTWEYARMRGLTPEQADDELHEVLVMAGQLKDGRPWTPPWRAHEYGEAAEPWRESWWHRAGPRGVHELKERLGLIPRRSEPQGGGADELFDDEPGGVAPPSWVGKQPEEMTEEELHAAAAAGEPWPSYIVSREKAQEKRSE